MAARRSGRSSQRSTATVMASRAIPESLTNPILLGTLLAPQGFSTGRRPRRFEDGTEPEREPPATLGRMQLPRRDVERLRQILGLQHRLLDLEASPRARRALMHRGPFNEAMTWLEIHGRAPEVLEHWQGFLEGTVLPQEPKAPAPRCRRRQRRRGRRGREGTAGQSIRPPSCRPTSLSRCAARTRA